MNGSRGTRTDDSSRCSAGLSRTWTVAASRPPWSAARNRPPPGRTPTSAPRISRRLSRNSKHSTGRRSAKTSRRIRCVNCENPSQRSSDRGTASGRATVRIALDMVREGLITKDEALLRVEPDHVIHLLLPQFDDTAKSEARRSGRFLAKGLNASPGAAMGNVVFDPDEAEKLGRDERKPVILVRVETSPDDVHGVLHSKGVLTARGGATSHAAVVTRGLGIPCVAGCEEIQVDYDAAEFRVGDKVVRRGESLSIDGSTGEVFAGAIRTIEPDFDREVELQT